MTLTLNITRSQQMALTTLISEYMRTKDSIEQFVNCSTFPATVTTPGELLALVNEIHEGNEPSEQRSVLIVRAKDIAEAIHGEQLDKAGKPYMEHVNRVAEQMGTDQERIVALLHDVIEDSPAPASTIVLVTQFGSRIADAVVALTHTKDETYEAYIRRVAENPLARKVKIADLYDNLDPRRMPIRTVGDLERVLRYHQALEVLL